MGSVLASYLDTGSVYLVQLGWRETEIIKNFIVTLKSKVVSEQTCFIFSLLFHWYVDDRPFHETGTRRSSGFKIFLFLQKPHYGKWASSKGSMNWITIKFIDCEHSTTVQYPVRVVSLRTVKYLFNSPRQVWIAIHLQVSTRSH